MLAIQTSQSLSRPIPEDWWTVDLQAELKVAKTFATFDMMMA